MNKKLLTLYIYVSFDRGCDWALFLKRVGGGSESAGLRTIKKELAHCKDKEDIQDLVNRYI